MKYFIISKRVDSTIYTRLISLYDVEDKTVNDINSSIQTFLRKYEALNRDELTAALMVNFMDALMINCEFSE